MLADLIFSQKTLIVYRSRFKENPLISDQGIYELYISMDPEWEEFSKQLAVMKHS